MTSYPHGDPYGQPHGYAPQYAPPAPRNGLGLAALILGLVGLPFTLTGLTAWIAIILGLIAVPLALAGRSSSSAHARTHLAQAPRRLDGRPRPARQQAIVDRAASMRLGRVCWILAVGHCRSLPCMIAMT
jgi:hypothetical protein